jgi:hypothetical protein
MPSRTGLIVQDGHGMARHGMAWHGRSYKNGSVGMVGDLVGVWVVGGVQDLKEQDGEVVPSGKKHGEHHHSKGGKAAAK